MTHTRAPQPFILEEDDVLDYESGRAAGKELNRRRVEARNELQAAVDERIDAETNYRKDRAAKRPQVTGTNDGSRKDELDKLTVDTWAARERAQLKVDIWKERLEEIDGQRATLHRLIEWSAQLDPAVAEVWAQRREQRDLMKAA